TSAIRCRVLVILRVFNKKIRTELKRPQGKLFKSFSSALMEAKKARSRGILVVSVGDRTTFNFISNGFIPDISIIDGMELRREFPEIKRTFFRKVYEVKNEAGTINTEIGKTILKAVNLSPALIKVDGEEDLLALLACVSLKKDFALFYGQPKRGVVMVTSSSKDKKRLDRLFREICRLNEQGLNIISA
ncbi:hypothetical protein DRN86_01795, partial [Candidatus Geothermarchaeota archaeon]